jgi:hypothetical protein
MRRIRAHEGEKDVEEMNVKDEGKNNPVPIGITGTPVKILEWQEEPMNKGFMKQVLCTMSQKKPSHYTKKYRRARRCQNALKPLVCKGDEDSMGVSKLPI